MKLRNKKTGEIREDSDLGKMLSRYQMSSYDSISELCEEWEDYKPAEPLIKDEKIRKAVRAMADITGVSMLYYAYYEDTGMVELSDMNGQILTFKSKKLSVEELDSYTIAELCGEEEE